LLPRQRSAARITHARFAAQAVHFINVTGARIFATSQRELPVSSSVPPLWRCASSVSKVVSARRVCS